MNSELYRLEKFISDILDSLFLPYHHITPEQLAELLKTGKFHCSKIREAWIKQLLGSIKDQAIRRYIQYQQAVVTQLANHLFQAKTRLKKSAEQALLVYSLYEPLSAELDDLLNFLQHRLYQYFDRDAIVTMNRCLSECERLSAYQRDLFLLATPDVDPTLFDAVYHSVTEKLSRALLEGTSCGQLEVIHKILHIVHHVLNATEGPSSTLLFASALYNSNLNTLHFTAWYQDQLQQEISKLPGRQQKETFIRSEVNRLSVIFVDPNKSFEPELPPVDQQLLPWLQSLAEETGNIKEGVMIKSSLNIRLPLLLSVPQFAMFIRVFQKTGCFSIHNSARIMRFFTLHFTTKKQVNISVKSFNHAFYSMDQSTAAVVRDYLQQMINYVNKTYFPK